MGVAAVFLRDLTTFRLGGACGHFAEAHQPDELIALLREYGQGPLLVIGEGSNLLCSDAGFSGTVLRYLDENAEPRRKGALIQVSGAMLLDRLCLWAAENGWGEIGFCNGIPGTVGGALAGNAGAFGRALSDRLVSVRLSDVHGRMRQALRRDLNFSYRHSALRQSREIVLDATFELPASDRARLLDEREERLAFRREHHPDYKTVPCAGSFFRNIEPSSNAEQRQAAGWFLEQVGAKAMQCGGAALYPKHANIIINRQGHTTARDVLRLAAKMRRAVRQKFGLRLVPEVQFVRFAQKTVA